MHRLGVWGMARRHHTYFISTEEAMGSLPAEAAGWNMFISVSAFLFFFSNFLLIANMIKSVIRGKKAPADPWGGWSFEWMTSSPPPTPSFGHFNHGEWINLPTLKDSNEEHIGNDPSPLVKWFQSLMVLDDENEEVNN
jgi:heme/copper-type cytochrome/quinol oxidase subunit 1